MNPLVLFWQGLPKPVREAIMWIGAILTVIILGKSYVEMKKAEAVRRAREKDTAKTIETVHEIQEEARHDADAAIEARDSAPRPGSADGVPADVAGRIFSD